MIGEPVRWVVLAICITTVAACALGTAKAADRAGPTSPQMTAYLSKMKPVVQREGAIFKKVGLKHTELVAGRAALLKLATQTKAIKPPVVLAEPHAIFVASLTSWATGLGKLAKLLPTDGPLPMDTDVFTNVVDQYKAAEDKSATEQRHWRTEVVVVLRRLAIAVPLWLSQVGQ